jgi:hypothetical protein
LEAGVGLILDKGWIDLTVVEMIREVPAQDRPDIEAAGVVLAVEGGYWAGMGRDVAPGRFALELERAAEEGMGWVKLIGDWPRKGVGPVANFTEAELLQAVEIANAKGARVAVHTMAREVPAMAVRAGVDSIEHGLFLSPEDLAALGERGGMWVPTVTQVETLIQELGVGSSGGRLLSEGLDHVAANLAGAVEAGVLVLTGTDLAIRPQEVAREAVRLWEMGLKAKVANAVLFAEDPMADPRVLAFPSRVVRMGRLVV